MGRAVIGAVGIVFESEGGALAADAAVQQFPEPLVSEFREIVTAFCAAVTAALCVVVTLAVTFSLIPYPLFMVAAVAEGDRLSGVMRMDALRLAE